MVQLTATGWAFLVARTPTRGYRLLLVPDRDWAGLVERHVAPGADGVHAVGHLTVVSATHRVDRLDEHGRPMDLVYGFATEAPLATVASEDLEVARARALDAYRRAVADEAGEPERSVGYPLRSVPRLPAAAPPRRVSGRLLVVAAVAVLAVAGTVVGFRAARSGPADTPEAVRGAWQGRLAGRTVTIDLGSRDGHASDDAGCAYDLSVSTVDNNAVTLRVSTVDTGGDCLPTGKVRVVPAAHAIRLTWYPPAGPVLTAELAPG